MSSETLIREVDEELRRDRLRKLWRQLGPWIIGGAVAVVLGVAGYEAWDWWQRTQAAKSSDQFYAAVAAADGKDLDAGKKALDDVIAHASGGYPILAQFREAGLLGQQGKLDEAVAAYDALANSLDNVHLRELALVLAGYELIDKGDVAAVQQRVGGLITPTDPLRNAAREALGLTQFKAGKLDDALATFQAITGDTLPSEDIRARAQIYIQELISEGAKSAATAPASAEPDASASAPASAVPAVSASAPAAVEGSSAPPASDVSSAASAASSSAP